MQFQLDKETATKLNRGIAESGADALVEKIFFDYIEASQGEDETRKQSLLTNLLAAEYRRIVYGN